MARLGPLFVRERTRDASATQIRILERSLDVTSRTAQASRVFLLSSMTRAPCRRVIISPGQRWQAAS